MKIDSYFDKAYIRLINNYVQLGKHQAAASYYIHLISKFDKNTVERNKSTLDNLQNENKEFKEEVDKIIAEKNKKYKDSLPSTFNKKWIFLIVGIAVLLIAFFFKNTIFPENSNDTPTQPDPENINVQPEYEKVVEKENINEDNNPEQNEDN